MRTAEAFTASGTARSLMAPRAFIEDDVFLTKAGHVGMAWSLGGVDADGLDHAQRAAIALRFRTALALLDDRFRVYSYLVKSPAQPVTSHGASHLVVEAAIGARLEMLSRRSEERYDIALYLAILFEDVPARRTSAGFAKRSLGAILRLPETLTALELDLEAAVETLRHTVSGVETQLAEIAPLIRLHTDDLFAFFRRLVNYDGPSVPLKYSTDLDYYMSDAPITVGRARALGDQVQLRVGEAHVSVLTMKDAPTYTHAGVLEDLAALPVSGIACLEWRRLPNDQFRRAIGARTRHVDGVRGKDANESLDGTAVAYQAAVAEMDLHGRVYGECSLTLVLHHPDATRLSAAVAEARKVLAFREGVFLQEGLNVLDAWASIVPGNRARNRRRLALLDTHMADLAFLYAPDTGQPDRAVLALETSQGSLYHYALHVQDVGHTLVLGATGAGKSFLLNALTLHLQQSDPHTVIFDLGHSYRTLCGALGGTYVNLGPHFRGTINPFALPASPETFHFLHAFCRVLIDGDDGYCISAEDDKTLYEAITNVYILPRPLRRLEHVNLPRRVEMRLADWVGDGRYASTFDNVEDTLDLADFQVFDFEGIQVVPKLLEPMVFYILHRLNTRLQQRSRLTVCVMDECWRFIKHPKLRDYVEEALKTWRKLNGAMLLATQAVEDFLASDLQQTVIESCPTVFFLANPNLTRAKYAAAFGLNETQLDLVTSLVPKRQVLLKRGATTKVLDVNIDPASAALFAAKGSHR